MNKSIHLHIFRKILIGFKNLGIGCMLLFCFGLNAQKQSKPLIPRLAYSKWHQVSAEAIYNKESWVVYKTYYNTGTDTLFIEHTNKHKRFTLANTSFKGFIDEKSILIDCEKSNIVLDLNTGNQDSLKGQASMVPDLAQKYKAFYYKDLQKLELWDSDLKDTLSFNGVTSFIYSKPAEAFLVHTATDTLNVLRMIKLKDSIKSSEILRERDEQVLEYISDPNGDQVAFSLVPMDKTDTLQFGKLGVYDLRTQELKFLNTKLDPTLFEGYRLTKDWQLPLRFSLDGSRLIFNYTRNPRLKNTEIPEVWHTSDPYFQKGMNYRMEGKNLPRYAIWDVKSDHIQEITEGHLTEVVVDNTGTFAVLYNPNQNRPDLDEPAAVDLYLKNLNTGNKAILEPEYIGSTLAIEFDPSGTYLAYPKHGRLKIYNLKTQKEVLTQITEQSQDAMTDLSKSAVLAWYYDEEAVLIQGRYDLWKFDWKSKNLTALTQGRTSGIAHKLIKPNREWRPMTKDALFVELSREYPQGYAIIEPGKAPKLISFGTDYVKWPKISADSKTLIFFSEAYDRPPALEVYHLGDSRPQRLFQSNLQFKEFELPRQELIQYTNSQGDSLQGILRYPAAYDPQDSYPMVVYVYEKQSQTFNHYTNPSFYTTIGFNPTNLVNRGYFVLQPDIQYQQGETAFSASDCIIAATKQVLQEVPAIDSKRLGLVGHSFGGFETGFTVTQTDVFATAVAGSGIYDNPSFYLFIQDKENPAYFQYERGQIRMPNSLFEDYQGYLENSALYHSQTMNTPLLLWSGKNDDHVDFNQTLDFYMGLRRLNKPVTMLLYSGMHHSAYNPEHQKDLTLKIEHWLDHHLKGIAPEFWVK